MIGIGQVEWGFSVLSSIFSKAIVDTPDVRSSQHLEIHGTAARMDYTFCFPPSATGSAHSEPLRCFVAQAINLEQTNNSEASGSLALVLLW